jgi:hypothetical protein
VANFDAATHAVVNGVVRKAFDMIDAPVFAAVEAVEHVLKMERKVDVAQYAEPEAPKVGIESYRASHRTASP